MKKSESLIILLGVCVALLCIFALTSCTEPHKHSLSAWQVEQEPTCIAAGRSFRICTECQKVIETKRIEDADAHTESDWLIEREAKCDAPGSRYKKCTDCGVTVKTEEYTKEHNPSDWIIDREATETEEGIRHKMCKDCGEMVENGSFTLEELPDGIVFEKVDETVYVREGYTIKIRSTPDLTTEENVIYEADAGFSAKRTGVFADGGENEGIATGWSRVVFIDENGEEQEGYTRSWYWTTEKPEE